MSIYQDHAYKHGVGWSTWHFQWVTKYSYNVFSNVKLRKLCEIFLLEAARRYKFKIDELEVAAGHVYVIATPGLQGIADCTYATLKTAYAAAR